MHFEATKKWTKAYNRLLLPQKRKIDQAILAFGADRTQPSLADHALKGHMKGLRAFSAAWDLRIIYREEGGFITIVLLDAGTHNQVNS